MARDRRRTSSTSTSSAGATATATSGGCMSAVRQFFDFHHFQFCLNPSPPSSLTLPDETHSTVLKGMEAPRNSLDFETEDEVSVLSSSKQDENLHIPMGMQIKTSCNGDKRRSTSVDLSEISPSPGTKTPTLVARLMGLDLLPDSCSSPSSVSTVSSIYATPTSTKKSHLRRLQQHGPGTRSLPETPRVSSSSSRRSVDADHRLSLQINKENAATEAVEFSRFTSMRRREMKGRDENRSPSEYARQILRQVKENVSKRVGLTDITNASVSRNQEQRRDQELLIRHLKLKKSSKAAAGTKPDDQSTPAKNSPRLRQNRANQATNSHPQPVPPKPLASLLSSSAPTGPLQEKQNKLGGGERFRSRLVKKPPQKSDIVRKNKEESIFRPSSTSAAGNIIPDHKSKKTPLSSDLVNTGLIPVKKDHPSPVTKIVVLQSQVYDADADADADGARNSRRSSRLRGCLSHDQYKQTHTARDRERSELNGGAATAGDGGAEHDYVTKILNRTGIHKDTPLLSFTSWFSPSHPLDSSLFHQLELSYSPAAAAAAATTTVRDRKLLFHLVDEMLVEILRPNVNTKQWRSTDNLKGGELVERLCRKIRSFPAKECTVLGDIDAIIDGDMSEWEVRNVARVGLEEEGERIVRDIEREMVESLVHETALSLGRIGV